MDIERWRSRLEALPLGDLYLYQEIGSTNTEAERLIQAGARPFSLVAADAQTAGQGRQGRTWITRPGQALAFSWILFPEPGRIQAETLGRLSGMGALAVAETLQNDFSLPAEIKWPNDVLVDGKKIAGILVEVHWDGCQLLDVILGIGVNVLRGAVHQDDDFILPAATLEDWDVGEISRLELLAGILESLLKWHRQLAEPILIKTWNENLAYKNKSVALSSPRGLIAEGRIKGVEDDGALTLVLSPGELRQFHAGEIQVRLVDRS